jgi:TetR/AcrR family transcriptional regulator, repressor for uid operon
MARPRVPEADNERRRQIVAAAMECFARKGFARATIADICRAAGVSPGHLYHYFPSKEALIEAIAATDLATIRDFAARLHGENLLRESFGQTAPGLGISGALGFELMAEAVRNPRVHAIVHTHYSQVRALFTEQLRESQRNGLIPANVDVQALSMLYGVLREGIATISAIEPAFLDAGFQRLLSAATSGALRSQTDTD